MKKIKTLLVGLGGIGFGYDLSKKYSFYSHAKILKKLNYINFVCGVDNNNKKLSEFIKNYKIDASNNLDESILNHKPDFVVVSVSTKNLFDVLKSISKYKFIKNVLVEKPGAENYDSLANIISKKLVTK